MLDLSKLNESMDRMAKRIVEYQRQITEYDAWEALRRSGSSWSPTKAAEVPRVEAETPAPVPDPRALVMLADPVLQAYSNRINALSERRSEMPARFERSKDEQSFWVKSRTELIDLRDLAEEAIDRLTSGEQPEPLPDRFKHLATQS